MGHTPTRRRRHPTRSNCQPGTGATVAHLPGPRCPASTGTAHAVRCREGCQMAATPPLADAPMAAAKRLTSPNTVGPVGIEPTTRGLKGPGKGVGRSRFSGVCAGQMASRRRSVSREQGCLRVMMAARWLPRRRGIPPPFCAAVMSSCFLFSTRIRRPFFPRARNPAISLTQGMLHVGFRVTSDWLGCPGRGRGAGVDHSRKDGSRKGARPDHPRAGGSFLVRLWFRRRRPQHEATGASARVDNPSTPARSGEPR